MAKAGAVRKARRKPGGKADKKPGLRSNAGRKRAAVKPSAERDQARARTTGTVAQRKPVSASQAPRTKAAASAPVLAAAPGAVPETPPPLPAPIASFTF